LVIFEKKVVGGVYAAIIFDVAIAETRYPEVNVVELELFAFWGVPVVINKRFVVGL